MNYYEHHIGDYQRKTAHLTLAEHGAYSLMLQAFYASERPLPADRKVLYRLLRAESVIERKAIDSVSAQFWEEKSSGLTNKRAEQVIEEYRVWVAKQKANGNRGGRPPKTNGLSESKPNGNPTVPKTLTETGDSHLRPPILDFPLRSNPLPPFEKGASPRRRSEAREERDKALAVWMQLIASGGAEPPRDAKLQAVIDAVGGWSRIEMRETGVDNNVVRKAFCDAYRSAYP